MKVKIDTKEKFHVITPDEAILSANIAAELSALCLPYQQNANRNIVLDMANIDRIEDQTAAGVLVSLQQSFYEQSASFVICSLQPAVEKLLEELELLEIMNVTPTESEAWDIVQMEEIERELLDDEEE